MNSKEELIEKTLDTDRYINSVEPSNELLNRLKNIPSTMSNEFGKIPNKVVWMVAASVTLLMYMNLISLKKYKNKTATSAESIEVVESHFSYLKQL
ncbi:MAG: hypothetical protein MK105_06115 [Crocinitomicaceae bacterium]|nr:hypothetical protein [Crocinitomicaceae bacterium]